MEDSERKTREGNDDETPPRRRRGPRLLLAGVTGLPVIGAAGTAYAL